MLNLFNKKTVMVIETLHRRIFGHEISDEMRKFVGNLGWMTLGTGVSVLFLAVTNLMAGRWLGPEEYGKYSIIISLGQLFIIPMLMGLSTSAIKDIASSEKDKVNEAIPLFIFLVVSFSILFGGLFFAFRDAFARLLRIDDFVYFFAIIYSISLSVKYIHESILKGLHKFRHLSFLEGVNSLLVFISFFAYIFLFRDYTFGSYTVAIVIGLFGYSAIALYCIRGRLGLFVCNKKRLGNIIHYGFYAIIGSIAGFIIGNSNQFIINKYLGYSSVGLFAAYTSASLFLNGQLLNVFINVFFPMVSKHSRHTDILRKILKIYGIIFIPLLLLNSAAITLIIYLYGKQYEFNIGYITLFSLNSTIYFYYQILMWLNNAEGVSGMKSTVFIISAISILLLILNFIFIEKYGIYGAIGISIIINFMFLVVFKYKIEKANN